tara:strand:+ start:202 stop:546 length:345 start_codon:yes stop_codon:yes gene_type:complete
MINASLNWASICGVLVFLLGLISAPVSLANIYFLLNRRSDNTSQIILLSIYKVCLGILRSIGCIVAGGILFFQGWRLDPILQFGQFLLVLLLILESGGSIFTDFMNWRNRDVML